MNEEELQEVAEEFYKYLDPKTKEEMKQRWVARETKRLQIPLLPEVRPLLVQPNNEAKTANNGNS